MKNILSCSFLLLTILTACCQEQNQSDSKYDRKEVTIPMRDGIHLHTVIFIPKGQTEALPFLLSRTPYGANKYPYPDKFVYFKDLAEDGYIFVIQDIRGRYNSEGSYVMQRFPRDKKRTHSSLIQAMTPMTGS